MIRPFQIGSSADQVPLMNGSFLHEYEKARRSSRSYPLFAWKKINSKSDSLICSVPFS